MLKVSLGLFIIRDNYGNESFAAASEPAAPIYIGNLIGNDGPTQYKGPSGGIKAWAIAQGLQFDLHQIDIDIDEQKIIKWIVVE